jgi:choline-sulfatase
MIRRGRWKYIHCDMDPAQLYDVEADPSELTNLATDPAHADTAADFAAEVARRWDTEAITANVLATQKRRRAVHAAMEAGMLTSWDYNPPRDAANEFVRNTVSWEDVLYRMQYPSPAKGG